MRVVVVEQHEQLATADVGGYHGTPDTTALLAPTPQSYPVRRRRRGWGGCYSRLSRLVEMVESIGFWTKSKSRLSSRWPRNARSWVAGRVLRQAWCCCLIPRQTGSMRSSSDAPTAT